MAIFLHRNYLDGRYNPLNISCVSVISFMMCEVDFMEYTLRNVAETGFAILLNSHCHLLLSFQILFLCMMRFYFYLFFILPIASLAQNNSSYYYECNLKDGTITLIKPTIHNLKAYSNLCMAYINGVWHAYNDGLRAAQRLADSTQHEVLFCYSACDKKNRKSIELLKALSIRYTPFYKNLLIEKLSDTIVSVISKGDNFLLMGHSKGGLLLTVRSGLL